LEIIPKSTFIPVLSSQELSITINCAKTLEAIENNKNKGRNLITVTFFKPKIKNNLQDIEMSYSLK
jgi:hypothetical protein